MKVLRSGKRVKVPRFREQNSEVSEKDKSSIAGFTTSTVPLLWRQVQSTLGCQTRYQHQALRASEYVEDNHEVEGAARLVSAAGGELAKVMD